MKFNFVASRASPEKKKMDPRLKAKTDLYIFAGYLLLGLAVLLNPFSLPFIQEKGFLPAFPEVHLYANDLRYILPILFDIFLVVIGGMIVWAPKRLNYYLNDSLIFNLLIFGLLSLIMFSLNVVHPGKLILLRIFFLLILLFFLTNSLYLGVVKEEASLRLHPFYRNLAVSVFGVILVLILLEGVFMFHKQTHRFNGTLGSRAWFLSNWKLNAEGYRDTEYDSTDIKGKKKVMVLGDSFVAGHGVKDPEDRFSNRLQRLLPEDKYKVFNLGVGGSDVFDENQRIREFPYQPDLLIISWYPNDIEDDGQKAGLTLQHARSYHDLWLPFRYVARRSYLWNYVYWQFAHPDELSDYFGFIKQCFTFYMAKRAHFAQLERLTHYGDSLQIPMAAVVFPFLENMPGSDFATEPITGFFEGKGIPVLDVRSMAKDEAVEDLLVNQNDPHPSEKLHEMVADSLFEMLEQNGLVEE